MTPGMWWDSSGCRASSRLGNPREPRPTHLARRWHSQTSRLNLGRPQRTLPQPPQRLRTTSPPSLRLHSGTTWPASSRMHSRPSALPPCATQPAQECSGPSLHASAGGAFHGQSLWTSSRKAKRRPLATRPAPRRTRPRPRSRTRQKSGGASTGSLPAVLRAVLISDTLHSCVHPTRALFWAAASRNDRPSRALATSAQSLSRPRARLP
mmetsp:Transcript_20659/g.55788  ORF Transcript_20659/g.55788 Transcript_20659/m.55788 type:complete len:209 (-) Transcript_20659:711-1337(-)